MNWGNLDPERTERGIQLLLQRHYPRRVRSIDGAGGDGGRDAQLISGDGRTVFEIKSFGRVTQSQRRQIKRSFQRALDTVPDLSRWVLVIPMNMTPGEEMWFDKLGEDADGVDVEWWGLDWLDSQLAEHMDIQRYIEGVDGQVLERAREFAQESAVLTRGADDLAERVENLQRRVNEVSPFWTLDFSVVDGIQTNVLRAKFPDSHVQDPITITPTFSFSSAESEDEALHQQLKKTLDFGGRVVLPPGHISKIDIEASPEAQLLFTSRDPSGDESGSVRCGSDFLEACDAATKFSILEVKF